MSPVPGAAARAPQALAHLRARALRRPGALEDQILDGLAPRTHVRIPWDSAHPDLPPRGAPPQSGPEARSLGGPAACARHLEGSLGELRSIGWNKRQNGSRRDRKSVV